MRRQKNFGSMKCSKPAVETYFLLERPSGAEKIHCFLTRDPAAQKKVTVFWRVSLRRRKKSLFFDTWASGAEKTQFFLTCNLTAQKKLSFFWLATLRRRKSRGATAKRPFRQRWKNIFAVAAPSLLQKEKSATACVSADSFLGVLHEPTNSSRAGTRRCRACAPFGCE